MSGTINYWHQLKFVSSFVFALALAQPAGAQSQTTPVQNLRDWQRPAVTIKEWLAQAPIQVSAVKVNPTSKGIEVILETLQGTQLQVTNRSVGNNFIADVSGGQLRLADGNAFTFRSQKPLAGITEITVTNIDANTIRVTVAGEASLPTVELYDSDRALIFDVATAASSTPPTEQPQQPQTPPSNQTQPTQPSSQSDEPIELVVTGEQDGYKVPDASTATKTDTPQRDIPQSIQVVPQQVLRDQNITRAQDALKNVPGISPASSTNSGFSQFTIRGFSTNSAYDTYLRNGLRDFAGPSALEFTNIDRVEILKGPASVLFGSQGNPGGTINLITKQPLSNPFYEAQATFGSYDFYRGALDLSGPLNDSKTVLYRLNASYRDSDSFIDFYGSNHLLIAPVLSFAIGKNTKLTFEGEYINSEYQGYVGLPAVGTVLPNPNGKIPRDRNTSEPSGNTTVDIGRIGYTLEHRFSDNWSLRNTFRVVLFQNDRNNLFIPSLAPNGRILNRTFFVSPISYQAYDLVTDIVGKFSTGSIQHQLLFGVDLNRTDNSDFKVSFRNNVQLDLFNPVYGRPLDPVGPFFVDSTVLTDVLGVYLQDQITLADNLKLLLGGRFDTFKQNQDNFLTNRELSQSGEAFSPRAGIVYQPIPSISLYASYTKSFVPVFASILNSTSTLFEPERGTQYEVGVKADLNNRLSATVAFYDLTRSNVVVTNPNNPLFSLQTGEQRSWGIELSLAGEILLGWNIIAGYAYTNAEITKDITFAVGNILNNVPKNSFNLWTTYEFQRGPLQGFGFGAGFFFVGDRQGDLANTFELPSYFRTDAAIFYKQDNFRAALNFRNLFDVDYFETATGRLNVYPGDPFTVQGTVSWQF